MPTVTIRHLSDETHRALKALASQHGCSIEAEIRRILDAAGKLEPDVKLGSLLAEIGREFGGVDVEIERDKTATQPLSFE